MRETFIGVFGGVVLIVSVLSFALMRLSLGDLSNKGEAQLLVNAAAAQLSLESLRVENWLAVEAGDESARGPFEAATADSRGDLATKVADAVADHAKKSGEMAIKSTGIFIFDDKGVVLGRDNSKLARGDRIGEVYPDVLKTVMAGKTGSALLLGKKLNAQGLASYAPIRNAQGKVVGGVMFTRGLREGLLAASEATGFKSALLAAVPAGDTMEVFAKTDDGMPTTDASVASSRSALGSDSTVSIIPPGPELDGAAKALTSYGNGKQAVVIAVTPARVIAGFGSLLWAVLGVFVVGLVLTTVCAHMLDKYISQPVADLEEGLLAIINGNTDIRFELEHKVYGGLVFRLNSLLNQLLGVQEDNTDDEGRPSHAPAHAPVAIEVDESRVDQPLENFQEAGALRDEAPEDYYKRIFDEYLAARRQAGDPAELKFAQFSQRIKQSELQLSQKHGKPFRFKVQANDAGVVMLAVPLE